MKFGVGHGKKTSVLITELFAKLSPEADAEIRVAIGIVAAFQGTGCKGVSSAFTIHSL